MFHGILVRRMVERDPAAICVAVGSPESAPQGEVTVAEPRFESSEPATERMAAKRTRPREPEYHLGRQAVMARLFESAPESLYAGRYELQNRLGRGGMGVVWAARDRELGRTVAVKVLDGHADDVERSDQDRLRREAKALALLSHPNVVAVYDVGCVAGQTFIAMEFVAGGTIAQWLRAGVRTPAEIVGVFVQAGRGLAAAHACGLVHRDFKPTNILIGSDGRVRVGDFGLARTSEAEPTPREAAPAMDPWQAVTMTGTVLGTPAYMAPEQHAGTNVDARADQFAYCVALWEALNGERPYGGEDLAASKAAGPPAWPGTAIVPARVVDAIVRGLAPDPDDRWPTMDAMLEALAFDPKARRARSRRVATVAVAAIAVAGFVTLQGSKSELCSGAARELADVWNDERSAEIGSSLLATRLAYAAATSERARAQLDEYASAWIDQHTEACEATTVRGEQSAAVMDLRMACLQRAKADLRSAVDVLRHADVEVVEHAAMLVHELPKLARCADTDALQREETPRDDPQLAARVEALRDRLAQAEALARGGKYRDAHERLEELDRAARAVGYPPVQAEVHLELGRTLKELGRYDEAVVELRAALSVALEHGPARIAANAATRLAFVFGDSLQKFDWAHWMADVGLRLARKLGDTEIERQVRTGLGVTLRNQGRYDEAYEQYQLALRLEPQADGEHLATATVHANLGNLLTIRGNYAEAEEHHLTALDLRRKLWGDQHPEVASSHNNLGILFGNQGKYAEAEQHHLVALSIRRRAFGDEHPRVAGSHNNLGIILYDQGRYAEAEQHYRLALALQQKSLGDEHPSVANTRNNLGNALEKQGKYDEAEQEHRAVLSLREKTLGPGHPSVESSHINLSNALYGQKRFKEAEEQLRLALAVGQQSFGADHPNLGQSHSNLGNVLRHLGRYDEAQQHHRLALSVLQKALGDEHHDVAQAHQGLAHDLLAQNRPAQALVHFERAWVILDRPHSPAEERAQTAFALAKLLWSHAGQRERARGLAERARDAYGDAGPHHAEALRSVERWLAAHR